MKKQQLIWNIEPAMEIQILPAHKTAASRQPAELRAPHRKIRIVLPSVPYRQSCATCRHQAGGDLLSPMHQAIR